MPVLFGARTSASAPASTTSWSCAGSAAGARQLTRTFGARPSVIGSSCTPAAARRSHSGGCSGRRISGPTYLSGCECGSPRVRVPEPQLHSKDQNLHTWVRKAANYTIERGKEDMSELP